MVPVKLAHLVQNLTMLESVVLKVEQTEINSMSMSQKNNKINTLPTCKSTLASLSLSIHTLHLKITQIQPPQISPPEELKVLASVFPLLTPDLQDSEFGSLGSSLLTISTSALSLTSQSLIQQRRLTTFIYRGELTGRTFQLDTSPLIVKKLIKETLCPRTSPLLEISSLRGNWSHTMTDSSSNKPQTQTSSKTRPTSTLSTGTC
jgi:hypothetical protein